MALVDTGLVVRYYLDEAVDGTGPTLVNDAGPNNIDLTINYGSGNLDYTEVSGNRGLESISTTGVQRADYTITSSDALDTALTGGKKFTLEVVVRVDAWTVNGSRIFGINATAGENGSLIVRRGGSDNISVTFNDAAQGDIDAVSSRTVIHAVIDSTKTANSRIQYSINGGTLTDLSNTVGLDETLASVVGQKFTMFNRENVGTYDRSFDGELFYAAMYNVAFSQTDIDTNYAILTADDDTPAGAADTYLMAARRHTFVNTVNY